ncbi:MAG: NAD-dependent epimerase/dehydratase family protein [Gemmatales bacterium]|nr:NAD-dependent epimerase/dehydratase family protein [Gemmatales bacterium]MDW7993156.1 NAD-dependent epimerase/dehydratase family protein [Gemmatales bacterium]
MQPNPDFWRGRLVTVTGGTGFLGWHIVKLLYNLGARIRIVALPLANGHPVLNLPNIETRFGDIRDAQVLASALKDCSIIFHVAGPVGVTGIHSSLIFESHVKGTANLIRYAPKNARIVYTSSVTTIGASKQPVSLDENHNFNLQKLRVPYIHAKRKAEQLALSFAREGYWVLAVNPGYLLGPEDYAPSVMGRFCRRFWQGRIWLVPNGGINVVDVRDVALGHLLAAEHGRPGQRYILGGHNLSFLQLCQELSQPAQICPRYLASCPKLLLSSAALLAHAYSWWRKKEPYPSFGHVHIGYYYWYFSSQKAREELGYRIRDLSVTIQDTWDWHYRDEMPKWRSLQRWWLRPAA